MSLVPASLWRVLGAPAHTFAEALPSVVRQPRLDRSFFFFFFPASRAVTRVAFGSCKTPMFAGSGRYCSRVCRARYRFANASMRVRMPPNKVIRDDSQLAPISYSSAVVVMDVTGMRAAALVDTRRRKAPAGRRPHCCSGSLRLLFVSTSFLFSRHQREI